ncbi:hypothetical protein HKX54_06380 [Sulfitobacter sp. M57]|uniref:hypothetical protein n=3 Tax=unclassified Sulfitobacter TaxID=196795 RepID=UPI0023E23819|nr:MULTISPECIES: hypothetical protein [unclassified Sulfitobacter]MDF3432621.1 hypothetical protein [Sulfitobacter sp. KE42]MDF3462161.1 hypothetical protein [Sulfitobacter sp. Ks18]MDF3508819.1 hypothetical protein [Sulfitobacter sp. M57]MDF3512717.1 hypothetical protein [Sulfitobacter sp. M36]MDF3520509.1 hypothetical protein [Sulfitobacter sp. M74]MDF3540033.1 hypothetical protein [Sulfitobacter sp. M62]
MQRRHLWQMALSLFLLGTSTMNAQNLSSLEKSAIERLETATEWLVRYGAFVLEMRGQSFLKSKLTEKGPVLLWVTPQVDTKDTIAQFRIKAGGYNYDIEAIYRETLNDQEFVYWVTHISAQDWATPLRGCRFHISTPQHDGKQTVLLSSERFIPSYKTAKGDVFTLPQDDLDILYKLRAWRFQTCFAGTDLAKTEVTHDALGKLTTAPAASPEER